MEKQDNLNKLIKKEFNDSLVENTEGSLLDTIIDELNKD